MRSSTGRWPQASTSDPLVVSVKMLRAELLSVKGDLEREIERIVLDSAVCGRTVHYSEASA